MDLDTRQWEIIILAIIVSYRKKYRTFFAIHVLRDESFYVLGRWCAGEASKNLRNR